MKNVSHKICTETRNTHFMFNNVFFLNRVVNETMWKTIAERGRPQMNIQSMRIAYWIPEATNTHRLCNTHCFSTTTMVGRTRLNVMRNLHVLLIIFRKILLGMRNVSDRSCRENQNIHFMFKNVYPKIIFLFMS